MPRRLIDRTNTTLERWLPEQRLFMKSDTATRFVRLRPLTQATVLAVGGVLFAWATIATSLLFIDSMSQGSVEHRAAASRSAFEQRLDSLAKERDKRSNEALAAQDRFQTALDQVSQMQSSLLNSEEHRRELETGIHVIQQTLRQVMHERDAARETLAALQDEAGGPGNTLTAQTDDMKQTVDMLSTVLGTTTQARDMAEAQAEDAREEAQKIALAKRQLEERNDEIFSTLENAVTVSMSPFDKMFTQAGMDPDHILSVVRRGYSGTGGPLGTVSLSSKSPASVTEDDRRAQSILQKLDEMNMYRIAADKLPFAMPLHNAFRYSSPFGYRWGRLHAGVDMAVSMHTPVYAPADGVVTFAGVQRGYGNVVKIRHEFGVSTVYGHLSKIRVNKGQNISQGDRIADSGNTGRSTGPHLHYEIRVGGKPVDPMTFIKAAKNVF